MSGLHKQTLAQVNAPSADCQVCDDYAGCNGDCEGYGGPPQRTKPICFQQVRCAPGPVNAETGECNEHNITAGGCAGRVFLRPVDEGTAAAGEVPPRLNAGAACPLYHEQNRQAGALVGRPLGTRMVGKAAVGGVPSYPVGAACPLNQVLTATEALRKLFGRIHGLGIVTAR